MPLIPNSAANIQRGLRVKVLSPAPPPARNWRVEGELHYCAEEGTVSFVILLLSSNFDDVIELVSSSTYDIYLSTKIQILLSVGGD